MAISGRSEDFVPFGMLNREHSEEIHTLLGDAVRVAHEAVKGSKLAPKSKPTKSLALMMLYHMAEKGETVHGMAGTGLSGGVETVVRSMLETHIDLQNLHNFPEHYPKYLFASATLNQRKQLNVLLGSEESWWVERARRVAATAADNTLEEIWAEKDTELDQLKEQLPTKFFKGDGKRTLETNIEVRAKWAGLHDEYDQIYRYLSAMAHSDMIAVTRQSSIHVSTWWPPKRNPCPGVAIHRATCYVIEAIDRVTKKLDLGRHKVPALKKRLDEWRRKCG